MSIPWQLIGNLWVMDEVLYHWGFLKERGFFKPPGEQLLREERR